MMSTVLETRLIPILADHHNSGKSIDILELSLAYGVDIITATIFGLPCGTNVLQDLEYRDWFFAKFKDYSAGGNSFWLNDVPELTARLQSLGLDPVKPGYYRAKGELEQWCLTLVHAAENLLALNASKNAITPGDKPIVFEKLWLAVEEEAKTNKGSLANSVSLSSAEDRRVEVASECLDHIIATREDFGAKTLKALDILYMSPLTNHNPGITLSSIFHQISQFLSCQQRIQQELQSISPSALPSPQALESLPYFNAAIKEALRLRPNPPTPNPRMTPPDRPSTIGPYTNIPPGTQVVAFSRCLHRNEKVFSDPNAFVPERWLRPKKLETAEEKEQNARVDMCEEWFWTFGSGSRMCLASNMAMERKFRVCFLFDVDVIRLTLESSYPHGGRSGLSPFFNVHGR
jgi:Cytochrome P450